MSMVAMVLGDKLAKSVVWGVRDISCGKNRLKEYREVREEIGGYVNQITISQF